MGIGARVRAAPGAAVNVARARRLLVQARRAQREGRAIDDVLRALTERAPGDDTRALSPAEAAAAVRRAARSTRGTACVPRAVALSALLHPSDAHVVVVLGARRDATGRWIAHAWVEVGGTPWPDDQAPALQRLAVYDARRGWALVPQPAAG